MNKKSSAGATFAKQKMRAILALAVLFVLVMGGGILLSVIDGAGRVIANAMAPSIASWWVEESDASMTSGDSDPLATFTSKKDGDVQISFKLTENYTPSSDNKYFAVKYSGTASLKNVLLWGTGPDDKNVPGWSTGNVAAASDWLVPVKTIGSDYSVVVIDLGGGCGSYGVDTVTNLGFIFTGSEGNTFVVHAMELLSSTSHNFGTPQPPVVEPPVERGEMEVCDMTNDNNNAYTITKEDDGSQKVSRDTYKGTATTIVNVKFWDSAKKYLIVDFETDGSCNFGIGTGSSWADLTDGYSVYPAGTRKTLVFDMSLFTFDDVNANLYFFYDAAKQWGDALESGAATTVTFHEISFSETDPNASEDNNHFRTPEGKAGVEYSASDKKITYTNSATETWRYLEIVLDNHSGADVLAFNLKGYNGLVLGVQVYGEGDIEGTITPFETNLFVAGAYYSEIKTDADVEYVFYLAAEGLASSTIKGVRLYFDAPANAGKDGNVELTLNSIEMLNSADLNPADVTVTAQNATVTFGATPNFNVAFQSGDDTIDGTAITEYRVKNSSGSNWTLGLPVNAGEYEVRFYYMGSRAYKFSRTTTADLTINKAAADPDTAEDGISFDADTRVVTVNSGYEASLSATFEAGQAVADGYVIPYGETKTVYYRIAENANHLAGTIMNKQFTAPEAPAKTLTGIAVTTQPTKKTYTVGEAIDLTGLVVTATYSDDTSSPINVTTAMLSGYDMTTAGTKTVTVTYKEGEITKTCEFTITVNSAVEPSKTLTGIAVTTQPTKKTYTVGEAIDLTGLVVTATYSDGTSAPITVTTAMLSGYDMTNAGEKTVKVTYEGKEATFKITVNEATNTGLGTTEIVLIVLAAVVVVAGAAAAVVIVLKKKNSAKGE